MLGHHKTRACRDLPQNATPIAVLDLDPLYECLMLEKFPYIRLFSDRLRSNGGAETGR